MAKQRLVTRKSSIWARSAGELSRIIILWSLRSRAHQVVPMGHNGTCHTSQEGNAVASRACTMVSSGAAHASVMRAFYEEMRPQRMRLAVWAAIAALPLLGAGERT